MDRYHYIAMGKPENVDIITSETQLKELVLDFKRLGKSVNDLADYISSINRVKCDLWVTLPKEYNNSRARANLLWEKYNFGFKVGDYVRHKNAQKEKLGKYKNSLKVRKIYKIDLRCCYIESYDKTQYHNNWVKSNCVLATEEEILNSMYADEYRESLNRIVFENNTAYHAETEEQANLLLAEAHRQGYRWVGNTPFTNYNKWEINNKNTCYYIKKGNYGNVCFAKKKNYNIVKVSSIINNLKTTKNEVSRQFRKQGTTRSEGTRATRQKIKAKSSSRLIGSRISNSRRRVSARKSEIEGNRLFSN